jgi:YfiH family protein
MTRQVPRDGFEWVSGPWGQVLEASALSTCADHFFTDRHLGLRGSGSGIDWTLIAAAIGVAPDRLFRPRQVHGRTIAVVQRRQDLHPFSDGKRPQADAVLTDDPSCAVAVQVADCVPILIADSRTGAVAAIHVGWRGAAAGVVSSAIEGLSTQFGACPTDLVAALGPSIGPCCYQVGPSVAEAFVAAGLKASSVSRWFVPDRDGRFRLDLWEATSDQLRAAGVPASQIHTARLCTVHDPVRFFSYRAEGAGTGRMAAVIRARG